MTKLTRITVFLPFVVVVFLNSFVDLGHKIIIQNTLFKAYDGPEQIWLTAIVNALILLPFILLFTPSGYLADRWPKPSRKCSTTRSTPPSPATEGRSPWWRSTTAPRT